MKHSFTNNKVILLYLLISRIKVLLRVPGGILDHESHSLSFGLEMVLVFLELVANE